LHDLAQPLSTASHETQRRDSLALVNEQRCRVAARRVELETQISNYGPAHVSRETIVNALEQLDTIFEHLTNSERQQVLHTVIDQIDHDPEASTISISLSHAGLSSFSSTSNGSSEQ
jgi:hypothetical protein